LSSGESAGHEVRVIALVEVDTAPELLTVERGPPAPTHAVALVRPVERELDPVAIVTPRQLIVEQ
jgi:hypothetical protein